MKRLMIDLETWSLRPDCAIRSIGAVFMTGDKPTQLFYQNIDDNTTAAFHREPSTVQWWSEQSEEARAALDTEKLPLGETLIGFAQHVIDFAPNEVWANGVQLDIVALEWSFRMCGIERPWKYDCVRDLRTERKRLKGRYEFPAQTTNKHHALDDALYQAREMIAITQYLGLEV